MNLSNNINSLFTLCCALLKSLLLLSHISPPILSYLSSHSFKSVTSQLSNSTHYAVLFLCSVSLSTPQHSLMLGCTFQSARSCASHSLSLLKAQIFDSTIRCRCSLPLTSLFRSPWCFFFASSLVAHRAFSSFHAPPFPAPMIITSTVCIAEILSLPCFWDDPGNVSGTVNFVSKGQ